MNGRFTPYVILAATVLLAGSTVQVAAQDKSEISLPITLQADQRTELRARVEGYVETIHVDIGDRVIEGQVLVTLDAPELEADVRRRQQMVKQAQANLGVARGAVATAEAKLKQAESARQEQKALKQLRVTERERYSRLVGGGAVQGSKLEEAEFAVMAVDAAVAKIEADVAAAKANVSAAKNEVEFAASGIEVAEAELTHAQTQDALREIRAPFAGLVTGRTVDPGRLVSPGNMMGSPLMVIEKIDVLRGVMTVPAEEAALVGVGNTVQLSGFKVAGEPKSPDGGSLKVSRISQSLDMKTRTMRVEIDLQNGYNETDGRYQFLIGQYGSATVSVGK